MRGLTRSMMRLIMPPLPAASRPSKMITMRAFVALTHSCSFTSSTCSLKSSTSYSLLAIFCLPSTPDVGVLPSGLICFFFFFDVFAIVLLWLSGRLVRIWERSYSCAGGPSASSAFLRLLSTRTMWTTPRALEHNGLPATTLIDCPNAGRKHFDDGRENFLISDCVAHKLWACAGWRG